MKAQRQPKARLIHATIGTAITSPALTPALHKPVASPRSLRGNDAEAALTQAAQLPASPAPNRNRHIANDATLLATACRPAAIDHHAMMSVKPMRVPMR